MPWGKRNGGSGVCSDCMLTSVCLGGVTSALCAPGGGSLLWRAVQPERSSALPSAGRAGMPEELGEQPLCEGSGLCGWRGPR